MRPVAPPPPTVLGRLVPSRLVSGGAEPTKGRPRSAAACGQHGVGEGGGRGGRRLGGWALECKLRGRRAKRVAGTVRVAGGEGGQAADVLTVQPSSEGLPLPIPTSSSTEYFHMPVHSSASSRGESSAADCSFAGCLPSS